jgi:hypothetical protein
MGVWVFVTHTGHASLRSLVDAVMAPLMVRRPYLCTLGDMFLFLFFDFDFEFEGCVLWRASS